MVLDPALLKLLVCPRHRMALGVRGSALRCETGHEYPVVEGVPVLLDEGQQTIGLAEHSLRLARLPESDREDPYFIETIGISVEEKINLKRLLRQGANDIDPVVSFVIGATNGIASKHLIGNLTAYPIPDLRLPPGARSGAARRGL